MGESLESEHDQDVLNPGFVAMAKWILSHRLLALLIAGVVAGLGVLAITSQGLQFDNRPEVFSTEGDEAVAALTQVREEFGRDDLFVVLIEGDVFSTPFLTKLKALEEGIAKIDIPLVSDGAVSEDAEDDEWGDVEGGSVVTQTTSLFTVRETRPTEDGIVVGTPLDAWPDVGELGALKERILANQQLQGRLIDKDGRYTTIIVQVDVIDPVQTNLIRKAMEKVIEPYRGDDFTIWLAGLPALSTTLNELNLADTVNLTGLAVFLIIFFLAYIFRSFIGVIGPIIVIFYSTLMSLSFMAAMGYSLNVLSTILPAFLVIVCVGDSVHLQSVYRDIRKKGVSNDEAIIRALGITGMPMLFTTLTTSVGLLAFKMASLDPVRQLGEAGAFGVFGAFFVTTLVLPVTLSWNKRSILGARKSERGFDILDGFLVFCNRLSGTSRRPFGGGPSTAAQANRRLKITLLVAVGVVAGAAYSAQFIKINHDPLNWLGDDLEVKQGFNRMDETVGGTGNIILMVAPTSERGLRDLDFIKRLEILEGRILGYQHEGWDKPLVTSSIGILDIIRETNQALHGGDPGHYKIPDDERALSDVLFLFENAGPEQLRQLATTDLSKTQVRFNIHWLPATEYQPLADEIAAHVAELFPIAGEVRTTGAVYSLLSTIGLLVRDLARSFGLAFLAITIMMVFLFGELKLGLLAMVPNLTPIMGLIAIMVGLDVPLDMSTLMVFSIAIGICVDDTIHFLHHFKLHYQIDGNTEAAITEALKHGGRAIVITSIVLIAGMTSQAFAQLQSISMFGILVGTTIALALLADLILAPAVLRLFYPVKVGDE